MKEMLKSKIVIGFVFMVLGIIVVDSSMTVRLEDKSENIDYIVMANIK